MDRFELIIDRPKAVYYNYNDLERIREHIIYLGGTKGIYVWSNTLVIDRNDIGSLYSTMDTMLKDIKNIRNASYIKSTTPQVPTLDNYNFSKANDVERILFDIEQILYSIEADTIYASNSNYAGQEIYL